jgi:hypothetical protein
LFVLFLNLMACVFETLCFVLLSYQYPCLFYFTL